MCWESNIIKNAEPITAEEDIKAIKFLVNADSIRSPYYKYRYVIGIRSKHVSITPTPIGNKTYIDQGYHCYQYGEIDEKRGFAVLIYGDEKPTLPLDGHYHGIFTAYECVIPKGTKYYLNEFHEIVSETIIIRHIIKEVKLRLYM